MYTVFRWIAVLATIQITLPVLRAAEADASAPPPQVTIKPRSVATAMGAGISPKTLEAVASAVQAYGVAWDLGDEKRFRDAISGTLAMVEMAVVSMHAEQAENAANQLARQKLPGVPVQPGTTQPARRERYPRTDYHRRVLEEQVVVTGNDQRVTIARPLRSDPAYVAEKTPQGWRVVMSEDELRGVPPEMAAEAFTQQRKTYEQLPQQINAGQFKTWKDYAEATSTIRRKMRDQLKAAAPATAPSAKP